jgi:hypothetical protein
LVGDTVTVNGVEYEVVWAGGEGLVGHRESKTNDLWEPPKRLYNKTSDYWTKVKDEEVVINPLEDEENGTILRDSRADKVVESDNRSGE